MAGKNGNFAPKKDVKFIENDFLEKKSMKEYAKRKLTTVGKSCGVQAERKR